MADTWQEHTGGIWRATLRRGDAVATILRSRWNPMNRTYHYQWDVGDLSKIFACGTAGDFDAAKRAAETALRELTE